MSLFQLLKKPDNRKTMLAYRVRYWPWSEMSSSAKARVRSGKRIYLPKSHIVALLNDKKDSIYHEGIYYPISWAWNNVPTEIEWNKKSDSYLIKIEFRISPLIPSGKTALLSFELPSSLDFSQLEDAYWQGE